MPAPHPGPAAPHIAARHHRAVIVGDGSQGHIGAHLLAGAEEAGVDATLIDMRQSWSKNQLLNRISHRLLRKRPPYLRAYSQQVVAACEQLRPDVLITTGIAPVSNEALEEIGRMGIPRVNYLTDDPWNRANGAGFFWRSLAQYDAVFTPRRSNLDDLRRHGCRNVEYMCFAYNPEQHFSEPFASEEERRRFACEVAFVGGADETRRTLVAELLRAGVAMKLYGGYWDRFPETRPHYGGIVFGRDLRLAVAGGLVNLCMGRAANRDGHAMRSFELPAMGACLIVEDTREHRELYGAEGTCVYYYNGAEDIVRHVHSLRQDPAQALRCARAVQARIRTETNTYSARLRAMLDWTLSRRLKAARKPAGCHPP